MRTLTYDVPLYRHGEGLRSKHKWTRNHEEDGFMCRHCHVYVPTDPFLSGVRNRNHCPYCLWSRHLDLIDPGDRLAACRGLMPPIGLTVKRIRKKYGPGRGELMLVHRCLDCGKLSINRIAGDDNPHKVLAVFEDSFHLGLTVHYRLETGGIRLLSAEDAPEVEVQLFGFARRLA